MWWMCDRAPAMSVTSACPITYNTLCCHCRRKLLPGDLSCVPDILQQNPLFLLGNIETCLHYHHLAISFFVFILVLGSQRCDEDSNEPKQQGPKWLIMQWRKHKEERTVTGWMDYLVIEHGKSATISHWLRPDTCWTGALTLFRISKIYTNQN